MAPGEEQPRAVLVEQTGPLKEVHDLVAEELLSGEGADVRHGHPLAGAGPAASGDEGVDVGMEIELVSERLDGGDHPGPKGLFLAGRHGHQLADGLPGGGAQRAQQPPVMHEVGVKELGDGEDPLGVADVGDDLVLQECCELGGALGAAGRAEPAPLAGEGEQVFGGAIGTADAGEASLEDAAVEIPRDHPVEEAAPEAVAALEEVFLGPLDGLVEGLEQRVQGRLGGPLPAVCGCLHGRRPWRVACRRTENSASGPGAEASARVDGAARGRGDRMT